MSTVHTPDELIAIVISSLKAEASNDTQAGRQLITDDFRRIKMVVRGDDVFPVLASSDVPDELEREYSLKGRQFHIWNTAASEETQTVFIELAEVEPADNKDYIWPYVIICQIENGQIKRTRHYGDPALLESNITLDMVETAVRG